MSMLFRTIGASTRTIAQAMAPAALILLALMIFTGFTIPTRDMLGWSRWINYLSPIAYAFESLMINEFDGRQYVCNGFIPSGPPYANVPATSRVCSTAGAVFGSNVVQGSAYLSTAFEYYASHKWRNFGMFFNLTYCRIMIITITAGILWAFFIFFGATYLLATEYISASKSKGEVLVFRKGHLPHKTKINSDKEGRSTTPSTVPVDQPIQVGSLAAIQRQVSTFHWEDVVYDIKVRPLLHFMIL
jgi:ATP-binding cassette, subfamily G (WHITE), member 2, PDR